MVHQDSLILNNSKDRWYCDLSGDGEFRVKELRNFIDDKYLPSHTEATRWVKLVPIKVNIFVWRARRDCLPTRSNLEHRGVDLVSSNCPICHDFDEDIKHILFRCDLAQCVLRRVCRWWNLDPQEWSSFLEWQTWFLSLRLASKNKDFLEGVFYVAWWSIWRFRNHCVFEDRPPRRSTIFDDIVLHSFNWCHSRAIYRTVVCTEVCAGAIYPNKVIEDYLYQKKLHEPLAEAKPTSMKAEDWVLLDRQALGAVRLSLAKNLVNTKMKEGASVADHINEFNSILSRLMSVDIKFDDEVQALLLLSSLPESWSDTVTAVSGSTETTKLKFDNIHDLIIREDIRRKTFGEYLNSLLSAEDKGRGKKHDRGQKQNRGRSKSKKEPVASKDKEVHMTVRDYDDALVCCVENTIDDHIMDSNALFHATYCKEELERFRLCSGKVRLADDKTLDVVGVGDVVLKTSFGTSWILKYVKESRNHPLENVIGNLNQRNLRSQAQNQSNFFHFISTIEPKNVNEALADNSWIVAMQEELNQFIANEVWELVPQPRNMTIIGTKWVFRNKLDENGVVSRNKARLVAQGYNQQEGIDYDETYALVSRL
ncbi:RNA-directed DNA polymerase, eukaryota [Tanacetum coccineum]